MKMDWYLFLKNQSGAKRTTQLATQLPCFLATLLSFSKKMPFRHSTKVLPIKHIQPILRPSLSQGPRETNHFTVYGVTTDTEALQGFAMPRLKWNVYVPGYDQLQVLGGFCKHLRLWNQYVLRKMEKNHSNWFKCATDELLIFSSLCPWWND